VKFVEFVSVSQRKASPSQRSNVRAFVAWSQTAAEEQRADAAGTLARAYLYGNPPEALRRDLEICLARIVEDPSILVRSTLAEALADAKDAPRHIIIALADDRPEIASLMLAQSPVLSDAELVEYATTGESTMQLALARRPGLADCVAARLAEIGQNEVAIALIENRQAPLSPRVARRLTDRFSARHDVRNALLARPELPPTLRYDLIEIAMKAQSCLVAGLGIGSQRIEKMTRAALERSVVRAASLCEPGEVRELVRHLRAKGALTAALLMRALISGGRSFFEAAARELSGLTVEQVAAFLRNPDAAGFAALYRRMGLPAHFLAPFRAALVIGEEFAGEETGLASRPIVSRVIAACENFADKELGGLLALLRRLEKEAALEEARAIAERMMAEPAAPPCEESDAAPRLELMEGLKLTERLEALERLELMEWDPPVLAQAS
jgi:uncharacterized protein (DUF2336 family)